MSMKKEHPVGESKQVQKWEGQIPLSLLSFLHLQVSYKINCSEGNNGHDELKLK